ncbi:methylmalonyl-CoA mutase family protein [Streptomyces sp. NPDC052020]|uniref:methylmalonyl-CoA mutase family protein n=1 Tax=Streptomyces sp. NPDC052020 TaxID=3155677 RepID=UPI00341F5AB7
MTGCDTAAAANARLHHLVAAGARVLPLAFDLATLTGLDSDAPAAWGLVGHRGVPVDSVDDMRVLLGGLPLHRAFTALAADTCAAPLLVLHQLVAEEHGAPVRRLSGSVGNDVLKDLVLHGPGPFPPRAALRLAGDVAAYCLAELPRWRFLSVAGHHLARAGADPAREIAYTVAAGTEYLRAARTAGLDPRAVAARVTLSLAPAATRRATRAKLRALRRLWARAARDGLGLPPGPGPLLRVAAPIPGGGPAPGRHDLYAPGDGRPERAAALEAEAAAVLERVARFGGMLAVVEAGMGPGLFGIRGAARNGSHPRVARPWSSSRTVRADQTERLAKLRAWRVQAAVDDRLRRLGGAARGDGNVLHPIREALAARATVGEVCAALREAWTG